MVFILKFFNILQIVKYNSQAPVEIAVTCDDDPEPPAPTENQPPKVSESKLPESASKAQQESADTATLTFTEIMVTAPTPRTQSPVEEQISFTPAVPGIWTLIIFEIRNKTKMEILPFFLLDDTKMVYL